MKESIKVECVQTQLLEFNSFDKPLVALKVAAKTLHVREDLLNSIPFFAMVVKNQNPDDGILLPDYNAQAIADVLHFVEKGMVEPLVVRNMPDAPNSARPEIHAGPHRYIRAYIAAHQLGIEDVQNSLLDILSTFYLNNLIQPEAILFLSKANLRSSKLYSLLMEEIARGAQAGFYNARMPNSSVLLRELKPDYKSVMEKWSPQDFLALAAQIGKFLPKKKRTIAVVAKVSPCLFHNHINTPLCKPLKRKREPRDMANWQGTSYRSQGGTSLLGREAHTFEPIEDDSSTVDDSPTGKRRCTSSTKHPSFLNDDATLEEQEHADHTDFQALEYEDIDIEIDNELLEELPQQLVKEEIEFSDLSCPIRSQTLEPDSPTIQAASSNMDPYEQTSAMTPVPMTKKMKMSKESRRVSST